MSFRNKGSMPVTVTVSRLPDGSGNFVCNGVADDVEINLAEARVTALGGGTVELGRGTFVLADPIIPTGNDVWYRGQGRDTFLDGDGLATGEHVFHVTGRTDIIISDLAIQTEDGGGKTCHCIFIEDGSDRFHVENVWIINSDDNGIHVEGTTIDAGCIDGCHILDIDGFGVMVDMDAANYMYRLSVMNCDIRNGVRGVIFETTGAGNLYCQVINNTIASSNDCICCYDSDYVLVQGNTCVSSGSVPIEIHSSSHVRILGNICEDGVYSIALEASSSDATIVGNDCTLGVDYAIYISNGCHNNLIAGNTCSDGDPAGISPIGIRLYQTNNNTVVGNNCQRNTHGGIALLESSDNTIVGNICYQNGRHGIFLDDGSNNNTIVGNICNENDLLNTNTYDGICIEDDCDDNVVHGNTCNDNDRWGISIGIAADDCVGNWVKNNTLQGNTSGPFSDQGTDTKLATIHCQLTQAVGGAALKDGAWAAPNGVDVDAATEGAVGTVWLPPEVQQVVRIITYGWSNVIEATNNMLLNVYIVGGSSSEQWNAESIDVGGVPSEETGGIIVNDVLHWIIDAGDDANIDDLVGGDLLHCAAVGNAADAPDIATDAVFGDCIIEYV